MIFSNLFKKNKKASLYKKSRYLSLTISEIIEETVDAKTIIFDQQLDYQPGQYLTLIIEKDGTEHRRSYSICSSPFEDDKPAITIKKDPVGEISPHLLETLKVGDELKVMLPTGSFTTTCTENNLREVIMIGAGSGITPLLSLIKSILRQEPKSSIQLIYANRDQDSVIFEKQLKALREKYSERFNIIHVYSRPSDEWQGFRGRLDKDLLTDVFTEIGAAGELKNKEFFICGPKGLMDTVVNYLEVEGVAGDRIHKESFVSSSKEEKPEQTSTTEKDGEKVRKVKVLLDGDEHEFEVEPDKSILETALDLNIDMPFSCQSGICTACRCKKISGEVYMEEDEGLSQKEKDEGYVLVCVGHPMTDDVILKVE